MRRRSVVIARTKYRSSAAEHEIISRVINATAMYVSCRRDSRRLAPAVAAAGVADAGAAAASTGTPGTVGISNLDSFTSSNCHFWKLDSLCLRSLHE